MASELPGSSSCVSGEGPEPADKTVPPDTFFRKIWQRCFPTGFVAEAKILLVIASPMILIQLSQFAMGPIAVMFCGRLGKNELAAVALSVSTINVCGISVANGLATVCDTFFSQAFGSGDKHQLGVLLQRCKCVLYILACACPCIAIQLNAERILVGIGQDPEVSRLSADYLTVFSPGLLGFFLYITLSKYLQCQDIVIPNVIVGIAVNAINALGHYILVVHFQYGMRGSALAQAVAYVCFSLFTLVYILASKECKKTWHGWSRDSFLRWGEMVRLSIFGFLMSCASWIGFEVSIYLAGILGTTELGAQSVIFQIESFIYMVPLGISVGTSIRVGQYLGGYNINGMKTVCAVAITLTCVFSIVISSLEAGCNKLLPLVFTNVPDVIDLGSRILPIMAIYTFFEAVQAVGCGVCRGSGRQHVGAAILSFYIVSLVVSVPVMFKTDVGLIGFWYCTAVFTTIQAILFFIMLYFTNWEKQAEIAARRFKTQGSTTGFEGITDFASGSIMFNAHCLDTVDEERTGLLEGKASNITNNTREYMKCALVISILVASLVVGVSCRLFVPVPLDPDGFVLPNNTHTVNMTRYTMIR